MKLTRALFALCLICFALAGLSFAQDKDSKEKDKKPAPPLEIKANVLVTNAEGKYVSDIKQEDLKIFEDGVEQKITYFAKKEPILNLGFVIDNTGSLRMQLSNIVAAGATVSRTLRPTDEAFVVRFVSSDKIQVVQDWTSNQQLLRRAFENMYIEGGQSAIIDALYLSADEISKREKKDATKRYALVLITDGEDRDSYYKLKQMLALIDKTDVQIFTIAFTKDLAGSPKATAEKFVRNLALKTGGNAYVLSKEYSDEDLTKILKSLINELSSQYVIGYNSTNQKRDDSARKLTVQIADSAKKAFIRESFVAPKEPKE